MKEVLDLWIQTIQTKGKQVLAQVWMYGFLCYIADCREQQIPSLQGASLADFLEYVPGPWHATECLEPLQTLAQTQFQTTLPTQEESDRFIQEVLQEAQKCIPVRTWVLPNLLAGEDLPSFSLGKKVQTRRVKGRRAITPIKRRGYKVFTRHHRRAVHVPVSQPTVADDGEPRAHTVECGEHS